MKDEKLNSTLHDFDCADLAPHIVTGDIKLPATTPLYHDDR